MKTSLLKLSRPFLSLRVLFLLLTVANSPAAIEPGFVSLFDGTSLDGWRLINPRGDGYGVTNGVIFCSRGGGGNLLTEKEYSDFVLRFEFKLEDGSNNGLGIRSPLDGDAAYNGIELQILEDAAADRGKWGPLRPAQYHGSIYDVIPAKRGALKPAGHWNEQEVTAIGRRIKVVLNGQTIVDADLNQVSDPDVLRRHPGILRDSGRIGFLGHNDYVEFRNIRIREVVSEQADNTAPEGFTAMFNGKDLAGWKGLVADPLKRAKMSPAELRAAQEKADAQMRADWKIESGAIAYRGNDFNNLCSAKEFTNFELLADWKVEPQADSGVYLRGIPQVQIWDARSTPARGGSEVGSGGLYNNKTHPSVPSKVADKPAGEWNRFRIVMLGDKVHVFLNGELVVNNVTLENYWDRNSPVFPAGAIELQAHKTVVWFKNIYVRELR